MNKALFFSSIRTDLFAGSLTQGIVDTINEIFWACDKYKVTDPDQIAYILGTALHESYHKTLNPQWLPVREGWGNTNASAIKAVTALFNAGKISKNYALPQANGLCYYGRGFVQITHPGNYKTLGKVLGIDLYKFPDKALDRRVAAEILVLGMRDGSFTGRNLSDYFSVNVKDAPDKYKKARWIVNGQDHADRIANLSLKFYKALTI